MHRKQSKLVENIHHAILQCSLSHEGHRFLLAVSGGIDSMALLHVMASLAPKYDWILHVAHLNHGLRKEAASDADFVQQVCRDHAIPFVSQISDVAGLAKASGNSIEIEARLQRYAFFAKVYGQINANALLTAHTRDDQAETILLNLTRGCSPGSLSGIRPDSQRKNMRIIRPMLHISRTDILAFMQEHQHPWHEDQTNNDLHFQRNSVRHIILPSIKKHLNPRVEEALIRCSEMAAEDETWLQEQTQRAAEKIFACSKSHLLLAEYRKTPPPIRRRVIVLWLQQQAKIPHSDIRHQTIKDLDRLALHGTPGSLYTLPRNHQVRHVYDHLVLEITQQIASSNTLHPIEVPGTTRIPELGISIEVSDDLGYRKNASTRPGQLPASCHIRIPNTNESLYIRTRREGDRIQMTGAAGHTKIKKILTDTKAPKNDRERIPMLATDQELIWVPGLRIAKAWEVPSQETASLLIRIKPLEP